MSILTENVGQQITEEIERASVVSIATAHFHPGDQVLEVLDEVPTLRVYIPEDLTTSDVLSLRSLGPDNIDTRLRCIPLNNDRGKFNNRMVWCRRKDDSEVAFVGSMNFTGPGLFSNDETCTKLDTKYGDETEVRKIEEQVRKLDGLSYPLDENRALRKRETAKPTLNAVHGARGDTNYWILKTEGRDLGAPTENDVDYWSNFRSESVIALGQPELSFNPSGCSRGEIRDRLRAEDKNPSSAHVIDKFANGITVGDLVILCKGYASAGSGGSSETSESPAAEVLLYGYARVEGQFYYDKDSSWWLMKYPAAIQGTEVLLPREIFVDAFEKRALPHPIHGKGITEDRVKDFCNRVKSYCGIYLEV